MQILTGRIVDGVGHFRERMTRFPDVFERATGEKLFPGTLNIDVGKAVPAVEHFRIRGSAIGEPMQDLLFEICRINMMWAYRIRPYDLTSGGGGHGDHILEIASSEQLRPRLDVAPSIEIALFRTAR